MATLFPGALDTFPGAAVLAVQTLATSPHSTLHGNLGDAVAAIEAKVGINGSTDVASIQNRLDSADQVIMQQVFGG